MPKCWLLGSHQMSLLFANCDRWSFRLMAPVIRFGFPRAGRMRLIKEWHLALVHCSHCLESKLVKSPVAAHIQILLSRFFQVLRWLRWNFGCSSLLRFYLPETKLLEQVPRIHPNLGWRRRFVANSITNWETIENDQVIKISWKRERKTDLFWMMMISS